MRPLRLGACRRWWRPSWRCWRPPSAHETLLTTPWPEVAGYLRACRRRQVGQRIAPGIGAMLLGFSALLYQHASQSRYPPAQAAYAFLVSLYLLPVRELDMVPVKAGSLRMGDVAGDGFFDDALPVHTVAVAAPFHVAWSARSSASSAASTAPG